MYVKKALLLLFLLIAVACQQETPQEVRLQLNKMEFGRSIQSGKISKWLNSPTPAIRKMAVEAIGRVQDPETIPLLANHLSDPDPAVRGAIYFALGQFRDNEAELQRLLGKALDSESDPDNQARIIEAIGKVGTVDFLPQLAGYLRGENLALQEAAARAAGIMAYRGLPLYTFAPNVSGLMVNTTNTEVASEAAQAVYRIQVLDSFEELYLGLDRESPEVRYQVLRGLAHMADLIESDLFEERKKVSPTKEIWQTYSSREFRRKVFSQLQDSTWYVRVAAIHLLESMPAQTSQNELVEMLNDPQPAVRVEAIRSLAAEPYRNWLTLREMRKIVRNDKEDWRIQGEALTVLALVEPKEALKIVQDSWMQEAWPKSYYALEALSNIQPRKAGQQDPTSDEATRLIIDMADGKSLPRTIKALELLPTRPRVPEAAFFLRHLENGDPAVLNIVANYFANIRAPKPTEAVSPLMNAFASLEAPRDLETMVLIVQAIGNLGGTEGVALLEAQLASPYPALREAAKTAYTTLTGKNEVPMPPVQGSYHTRSDFHPVSTDSLYEVTFYTSAGDFTLTLWPDRAPANVASIVALVKNEFYNGILFHRVIPGFVAQFGDPQGVGYGGPGYATPCEYSDAHFDRGVVGVAHAGKDTGSSQLFITQTPQPHLDGFYTAVGEITRGLRVTDRLMPFDHIIRTGLTVKAK